MCWRWSFWSVPQSVCPSVCLLNCRRHLLFDHLIGDFFEKKFIKQKSQLEIRGREGVPKPMEWSEDENRMDKEYKAMNLIEFLLNNNWNMCELPKILIINIHEVRSRKNVLFHHHHHQLNIIIIITIVHSLTRCGEKRSVHTELFTPTKQVSYSNQVWS